MVASVRPYASRLIVRQVRSALRAGPASRPTTLPMTCTPGQAVPIDPADAGSGALVSASVLPARFLRSAMVPAKRNDRAEVVGGVVGVVGGVGGAARSGASGAPRAQGRSRDGSDQAERPRRGGRRRRRGRRGATTA